MSHMQPRMFKQIPSNASLLLDLIRFGAAIVVTYGHLTQHMFSVGWIDRTPWAFGAVSIFFVLSGFVIRYVTTTRVSTSGEYAIDRLSRIYSVVIPAILLTVVCDLISLAANRSFYLHNWGISLQHPLFKVFANLTFTSQFWGVDLPLLSNSPFWSLSYECMYYIFYGILFLGGKSKWLFALALAVMVGAPILYLMPLWLLGCLCYDVYQRLRTSRFALVVFAALSLLSTYLSCRAIHSIHFAAHFAWQQRLPILGDLTLFGYARPVHTLGLRRATENFYLVGLPAALIMLSLLLLVSHLPQIQSKTIITRVRYIADGTFTLYLIHFPLLVLAAAVIPYDHASSAQKWTIFAVIVGLSIWLAGVFDQLKNKIRVHLHQRYKVTA